MRPAEYPALMKTKRELILLDQLYTLYMDVEGTIQRFKLTLWQDIDKNLPRLFEAVMSFDVRAKSMPKKLCEWEAYKTLTEQIEECTVIFPLIQELSKPFMRRRHWDEIAALTGKTLLIEDEELTLELFMNAGLMKYKVS